MAIMLGAVKPWVRAAFTEIQSKYPCQTVFGNPSTGKPDHLAGLAIDFMVFDDRAKGENIAQYAIANYQRLGIGYVIWWQRIWYPSKGWSQMADRGSINANHKNHVHVNFKATAPTGGGAVIVPTSSDYNGNPFGQLTNPLDALSGLGDALAWITDVKNLGRIGMFLLGAGMILVTIGRAMGASQVVKSAAKSTVKVASNVSKS